MIFLKSVQLVMQQLTPKMQRFFIIAAFLGCLSIQNLVGEPINLSDHLNPQATVADTQMVLNTCIEHITANKRRYGVSRRFRLSYRNKVSVGRRQITFLDSLTAGEADAFLERFINENLGILQSLKDLNYINAKITTLPKAVKKLNVEFLNIESCPNFRLPIWINELPLEILRIVSCNLVQIPASLGGVKSLEILELSNCQLTGEIPSSLGNLENLVWLNLSNNQLTGEIPASFENLHSLKAIDLSGNNLSGEVPESFENLNEVYLSDNEFKKSVN